MENFTVSTVCEGIYSLTDPTGVHSFLVVGKSAALLLDTGTGFVGLDKAVRELTRLPLSVLLTHGHGDHAGGAAAFERVYLCERDWALYARHATLDMRMGYARAVTPPGTVLSEAIFVPVREAPLLPLADGQIFDLGEVTVETIPVPGHTRGMTCALIREARMILYGDACNPNTLLVGEHACTVSEYLESLRALKRREREFDFALSSHGPTALPKTCLDDNIELCERILAGTDDAVPAEFMGTRAFRAAAANERYQRLDGKIGNIVYTR